MGKTIRNVESSSLDGVASQTWFDFRSYQNLQSTTSTASSLSNMDRKITVEEQTVFPKASTSKEYQDRSGAIKDLQSSSTFTQRAAETPPDTARTESNTAPFRELSATNVRTSETPQRPSSSSSNQYSEGRVRTSGQSSMSGQTDYVGTAKSYPPTPSTSGSSSETPSSRSGQDSDGVERLSTQAAMTSQTDSVGTTGSYAQAPSTSQSLIKSSNSSSNQLSEEAEPFPNQVAVTSQTDPVETTESYFPTPTMSFGSSSKTSSSRSGLLSEGAIRSSNQPTVASPTETIAITELYAHTPSISESLSRPSASRSEQYQEGTESLLHQVAVTRHTDSVENTESYTHRHSTYKPLRKPSVSESEYLAGTGHFSTTATVTRQIDSVRTTNLLGYPPLTSEPPSTPSSSSSGQYSEETEYHSTQAAVTGHADRVGISDSFSSAAWTTESPWKQPSPKTGQHSAGTEGLSSDASRTRQTESVESTESLMFTPVPIESAWSSARSEAEPATKGYQINSEEGPWSTPLVTTTAVLSYSPPQRPDVIPLESQNSWPLVPSWSAFVSSVSSLDYESTSPLSKVLSMYTSYTQKTSIPSATTVTSADGGSKESHTPGSTAIGAVGGSVAAGVVVLGALFLLIRWRGSRSRGTGTSDPPAAPPDTTRMMADGYRNLIGRPELISPRSTLIHPALRGNDNRIDSRSVDPSQQTQYLPPGFF